jgi:hypothetical protein
VYLCASPILLLALYCWSPEINEWWKGIHNASTATRITLQPELAPVQPVQADLQLSSQEASVACGRVLKLNKSGVEKLNLVQRLNNLVEETGFTDKDFSEIESRNDLEKHAFSAYALAYATWEKSTSRDDMDKMVMKAFQAALSLKLSPEETIALNVYLVKYKRMLVNAFDLGRHDAKVSPCPL